MTINKRKAADDEDIEQSQEEEDSNVEDEELEEDVVEEGRDGVYNAGYIPREVDLLSCYVYLIDKNKKEHPFIKDTVSSFFKNSGYTELLSDDEVKRIIIRHKVTLGFSKNVKYGYSTGPGQANGFYFLEGDTLIPAQRSADDSAELSQRVIMDPEIRERLLEAAHLNYPTIGSKEDDDMYETYLKATRTEESTKSRTRKRKAHTRITHMRNYIKYHGYTWISIRNHIELICNLCPSGNTKGCKYSSYVPPKQTQTKKKKTKTTTTTTASKSKKASNKNSKGSQDSDNESTSFPKEGVLISNGHLIITTYNNQNDSIEKLTGVFLDSLREHGIFTSDSVIPNLASGLSILEIHVKSYVDLINGPIAKQSKNNIYCFQPNDYALLAQFSNEYQEKMEHYTKKMRYPRRYLFPFLVDYKYWNLICVDTRYEINDKPQLQVFHYINDLSHDRLKNERERKMLFGRRLCAITKIKEFNMVDHHTVAKESDIASGFFMLCHMLKLSISGNFNEPIPKSHSECIQMLKEIYKKYSETDVTPETETTNHDEASISMTSNDEIDNDLESEEQTENDEDETTPSYTTANDEASKQSEASNTVSNNNNNNPKESSNQHSSAHPNHLPSKKAPAIRHISSLSKPTESMKLKAVQRK